MGIEVVVALAGLLGSAFAGVLARWKGRSGEQVPPSTLPDRIEQLRTNLAQSSSLINEINAELHLQTASLDKIRAEAEENQRLAALHQEHADAVRDLVAATIENAQAKAAKPAIAAQWLFFLGGLLFSVPLGVGGNLLYDAIFN